MKTTESTASIDALRQKYQAAQKNLEGAQARASKILGEAQSLVDEAKSELAEAVKELNKELGIESPKAGRPSGKRGKGGLAKSERKILNALMGADALDYDGIVAKTGIKNPSSVLGKVREKGLMEGKGKGAAFRITAAGRAAMSPAESSDTKK